MRASPDARPYLIVSASGRALAQSAARQRIPVVVLDLFNDLDTRALASASRACAGRNGRFDRGLLMEAVRELAPRAGFAGLIYGSGLEGRPALLRALAREVEAVGNAPATVAQAKDPARFFPLLDDLDIPHPAVRGTAPPVLDGWLSKRAGGAGGGHVRPAVLGWPRRERRYFQRFQPGRAMSVLFLADGRRAQIVGFNEQWPVVLSARMPFAYGGAIIARDVPPAAEATAVQAADRLTAALGLRGLNGLDFMLDGESVHVVELNPRPTATLDLYDAAAPCGLLARHIDACRGELGEPIRADGLHRAQAIVYAQNTWQVPHGLAWPKWVTDVPASGSTIPASAPICTVHAQAATAQQTRLLAFARREQIHGLTWEQAA
jgi:predicted ATP-grasp superfamily ATP-dependent carboligase